MIQRQYLDFTEERFELAFTNLKFKDTIPSIVFYIRACAENKILTEPALL